MNVSFYMISLFNLTLSLTDQLLLTVLYNRASLNSHHLLTQKVIEWSLSF